MPAVRSDDPNSTGPSVGAALSFSSSVWLISKLWDRTKRERQG